ncbi:MAG: phosphoglycerate kinase [Vicinamibacterales bacterium]
MAKLTIHDLSLHGRRLFLRVDYNVPIKNGAITDDTRIRATLPTLEHALGAGALPILASHLGRPKGTRNMDYTLAAVATRLAELTGRRVVFADDCIGPAAEAAIDRARQEAAIVLLENLRFHPQEEKNDPDFSRKLADLADDYVDDAFGAAHRAHASVEGMTHFFARPAAGLLMEQELRYLGHALESPERPFVAILGGAKVSDKLEVIENMLGKVDRLIIGGAMAYTFMKSRGIPTGKSLVEDDKIEAAKKITEDAAAKGVELALPVDHVVTTAIAAEAPHEVLAIDDPAIDDRIGVDIGPKTVARYEALLADAHTVVWNGPMGVFEIPAFAGGTNALARAVTAVHGTTIVGGGDSISAIKKSGLADRVTHISTGGGASLEFLGGRILPGVAALKDR